MKLLSLTLIIIVFAACCEKDPEMSNTDCIEMQQNPNFKTEDLNLDYTIQFPNDYQGDGLKIEEFAEFLKYSDKV